jgi:hypothetical protein
MKRKKIKTMFQGFGMFYLGIFSMMFGSLDAGLFMVVMGSVLMLSVETPTAKHSPIWYVRRILNEKLH